MRKNECLFALLALLAALLSAPALGPRPAHAEPLNIVYGNDNLGELGPCG